MKKIVVGLLLCFFLAIVNRLVNIIHVSWDGVSTLYTVVGVMFSVGMSLIISVSTNNVLNIEAKKDIRKRMKTVTYNYVVSFAVVTLFYILFNGDNEHQGADTIVIYKWLAIKKGDFITMLSAMSIIYYVVNFMTTQNTNREIEDIIDKEKAGS